jgi:hypothetical protein
MTLISMGLVLVKLTVASCSALAISRCAFFCLERGMTLSQFGSLISFKLPPQIFPHDRFGAAIILVLLGVIPQAFIAPLLSGAVNWNAAFEKWHARKRHEWEPNVEFRALGVLASE